MRMHQESVQSTFVYAVVVTELAREGALCE